MGKPLISDAQMHAMYRTMLHLRQQQAATSARSTRQPQTVRRDAVAMLAATLLQLRTEDVLITQGEQPLALETVSLAHEGSFNPAVLPTVLASPDATAVASLAAGYALAQSRYSHPGDAAPVTVALLQPDASIDEATRLAGEYFLPLLLLVREDPALPRRTIDAPANVEVILIDAEDAVACCRVMQESLLRARNRWGSVVLRGVSLPGTPDAVESMQTHLERRNIQFDR